MEDKESTETSGGLLLGASAHVFPRTIPFSEHSCWRILCSLSFVRNPPDAQTTRPSTPKQSWPLGREAVCLSFKLHTSDFVYEKALTGKVRPISFMSAHV
jgi:hypothetical protein